MDSKLTLKVKQNVIRQAKKYAKKRKTSLSKLVENYLQKITLTKSEENDSEKITPLVRSLSGVLKQNTSEKETYTDFLQKKYQ